MDEFDVIYLDDDERNARASVIDSRGRPNRRPPQGQPPQSKLGGLGNLTTGEIIELAAQLLAAIQPLPGAPSGVGDVETDVENLVIYQTALATHAKRDEQLRTLGSLLAKVLK